MKVSKTLLSMSTVMTTAFAQTAVTGVSIPPELAYLLPEPYTGKLSANFIDTKTPNNSINAILSAARNATFYAYDQEFYSIVGPSPTMRFISVPPNHAHEAGCWVFDKNQVWFTSFPGTPGPQYSILNLNNYTITIPNTTLENQTPNLAGGNYYNGSVHFAAVGSIPNSIATAIYAVDATTGATSIVLNSYFGVPLNSIDDLSWVTPNTHPDTTLCTEPNLFFSTLDLGANNETEYSTAVLPNAVYRYTPSTHSLQAAISRGDVLVPNGVRADPTGRYLYITDVSATALAGAGAKSSGSVAVYRFDLDSDCNPVNKRLFAAPRSGIADGIQIDDFGQVWTAEYNGIVVRNERGKELGVFNAEVLVDTASYPISMFSLAGDKLVVEAGDKLVVVQLAVNVTTPAGSPSVRT
jgi:gluconolactonase